MTNGKIAEEWTEWLGDASMGDVRGGDPFSPSP